MVHAGMDLLRDQVRFHCRRAIMELMDDIAAASATYWRRRRWNTHNTSASKSRISFHWTGNFELDFSWKSLVQRFGQNFKWAAKKTIYCKIIDETGCAAEYLDPSCLLVFQLFVCLFFSAVWLCRCPWVARWSSCRYGISSRRFQVDRSSGAKLDT